MRPPCWVGKILIATFREGHEATHFLGKFAEHGKVFAQCTREGFLVTGLLISIKADDVHTVIAWERIHIIVFHTEVGTPAPCDICQPISQKFVL